MTDLDETQLGDTLEGTQHSPRRSNARRVLDRGTQLGRYLILSRLGAGGMGEVYAAHDPELDRRVALKLLHAGPDDGVRDDALRLQREAQAMAKLSHPNVITVHDVGQHEGRVFVAMELVDGTTLTEHLSQPRSRGEILSLFVQAGRGLAAAHSAGLVHRDFKPDNVMVGRDGRVRVMDFGLARPTDPDATEPFEVGRVDREEDADDAARSDREAVDDAAVAASERTHDDVDDLDGDDDDGDGDGEASARNAALAVTQGALGSSPAASPQASLRGSGATTNLLSIALTRAGRVVGTPAYMAPEQHACEPADARTDQFSFCVALFEAVVGQPPFHGNTVVELAVAVTEGQLRFPGTASVPPWLRRALRRGLSPKPDDRWPSMDALLRELQQGPGRVRRRVTAALGALVLVGAGVGAWQWSQRGVEVCRGAADKLVGVWDDARRTEVEAAMRATGLPHAQSTWDGVRPRLDAYAERWVAAHTDACEATQVRREQSEAHMDARMRCLHGRMQELRALSDTLVQVDGIVLDEAVRAADGLAAIEPCADPAYVEAQIPPPEDPAIAQRVQIAEDGLVRARTLEHAGKYAEGLQAVQALEPEVQALAHPPLTQQHDLLLAELLRARGRYADAEAPLRRAYLEARRHGMDEAAARAATFMVGLVGWDLARYDDALQWAELARAEIDNAHAEDVRSKLLSAIGTVYTVQSRDEEAEALLLEALRLREARHGPEHLSVADVLDNLGNVVGKRDAEAALAHHRRALAIREAVLGPEHPEVGVSLIAIATNMPRDRADEAKAMFDRVLALWQESLGAGHPNEARALSNMGNLYYALEEFDKALEYHQRALDAAEKALGPEHELVGTLANNLAGSLLSRGRAEEAVALQERAVAIRRRAYGEVHPQVASGLDNLGVMHHALGRIEKALEMHREALAIQRRIPAPNPRELANSVFAVGYVTRETGHPVEALPLLLEALSLREAHADLLRPGELAFARFSVAESLWDLDRDRARARTLAEQALEGFSDDSPEHEAVAEWLAEHPAPE